LIEKERKRKKRKVDGLQGSSLDLLLPDVLGLRELCFGTKSGTSINQFLNQVLKKKEKEKEE